MGKRRIVIVMHNDLMNYPPMISLIDLMKVNGEEVTYIGSYSESPTTARFTKSGVKLIQLGCRRTPSDYENFLLYKKYKKELSAILEGMNLTNNDIVWYVYSHTACFIHDILARYRYLIHYYEFVTTNFSWKYRLLYPSYHQDEFIKRAYAIVHCEYNRGQIFRALNGLDNSPYIIPNKPYVEETSMDEYLMPKDVKLQVDEIRKKVDGKKVILYQGYFASKERRLEEFCVAVNSMPSEYVMIAMGKGPGNYYEKLKNKYESDRIIFVPFIIPPFHLYVTELASVGVMSYSPHNNTIDGVVNVLYCAPNKIFEYGKYGKPMIANNVPALKNIFEKYHCGEVVDYPITPFSIKSTLEKIFADIREYSKGATVYYNSVEIENIVKNVLNNL